MPEAQTVVEQTDDTQQAVSDEANAQDLDTLLAEYDDTTTQTETEKGDPATKLAPSEEKKVDPRLDKIDQVYK